MDWLLTRPQCSLGWAHCRFVKIFVCNNCSCVKAGSSLVQQLKVRNDAPAGETYGPPMLVTLHVREHARSYDALGNELPVTYSHVFKVRSLAGYLRQNVKRSTLQLADTSASIDETGSRTQLKLAPSTPDEKRSQFVSIAFSPPAGAKPAVYQGAVRARSTRDLTQ